MDSKQAFPEQSSGDESKKDMEQTKFLTAHHIIGFFLGSGISSQVETINQWQMRGKIEIIKKNAIRVMNICTLGSEPNFHLDLHPKFGNIKWKLGFVGKKDFT